MRRPTVLIALALVVLCALLAAIVQADSSKDLAARIRAQYPGLQPESITKTPIEGLWEVVVNRGTHVIYYAPGPDLIIAGDIYKGVKSLTEERRNELRAAKFKTIPLEKAIRIGNGRHQVVEFTDPDCPFCRKASSYLKGREKDLTRYIFLRPLVIHPRSAGKCRYVLAQHDRAKAYEEVMSGKFDRKDPGTPSSESSRALDEHRAIAERAGIQGTPVFWVDGRYVAGANLRLLSELLK
jgi:thiol:disulfide interchange protein DsbC